MCTVSYVHHQVVGSSRMCIPVIPSMFNFFSNAVYYSTLNPFRFGWNQEYTDRHHPQPSTTLTGSQQQPKHPSAIKPATTIQRCWLAGWLLSFKVLCLGMSAAWLSVLFMCLLHPFYVQFMYYSAHIYLQKFLCVGTTTVHT